VQSWAWEGRHYRLDEPLEAKPVGISELLLLLSLASFVELTKNHS
jgi:hypothetical protein